MTKEERKEYCKQWRLKNPNYQKEYILNNAEFKIKRNTYNKEYRKRENAKEYHKKYNEQWSLKNQDYHKKLYADNKEDIKASHKVYVSENRDKVKEYHKNYYIANKTHIENINEINSEQRKEVRKLWVEKNKDKLKERQKQWNVTHAKERLIKNKMRREIDPLFKLSGNIRSLIYQSFKTKFTAKAKRTTKILGCSFAEFKIHLEKQFDEHMNWKNQGTYWEMDHKIPISSAKTEAELYKLNHYTNFQPLSAIDNMKKGNKIITI